jgi:8-oxo-dGTP diphosphatase
VKIYNKFALCIIKNNHMLVQEEIGEDYLLLPGGRAEAGEGAIQALCREIKEELGIELDLPSLKLIGEFQDEAASNPGAQVCVELYQANFHGELRPCSEVKKLIWISKEDDWSKLAPVTRNKILPALVQKGMLT